MPRAVGRLHRLMPQGATRSIPPVMAGLVGLTNIHAASAPFANRFQFI